MPSAFSIQTKTTADFIDFHIPFPTPAGTRKIHVRVRADSRNTEYLMNDSEVAIQEIMTDLCEALRELGILCNMRIDIAFPNDHRDVLQIETDAPFNVMNLKPMETGNPTDLLLQCLKAAIQELISPSL